MIPDEALQHFDRFLDGIEEAVRRFPREFRRCSVEALTQGTDPLFCLVRGGISKEAKSELLDYGKMQLRREVFSSDDLRRRLLKFNKTGRLDSADAEIGLNMRNSTPYQTFYPSQSPYHTWPGHLYEMGSTGQVAQGLLREPLVGKGLPPFFDAQDAITNWIRLPISRNDGRFGKFLLFIPDFTVRLGRITFADAVLHVEASFVPCVLSISVLATDGRTTFRKTKPLGKAQSFKLIPNPSSLRIFVTNEKGEILDSFAEEEAWTTRERVLFTGARYSKEVMEMIRRGESDSVEFKEFIRLDDKKKAAELVKAVISFANTRGGTIFIGVTDDAEIMGVESHIPHDKRKAGTFETVYFTGLRTLLKQKLNRIPPIQTRTERIGDKTVFVVQVAEGTAKPYTNVQTRETFVRRGASDVRPDPDTDLRLMLESGFNPLPFRNPR